MNPIAFFIGDTCVYWHGIIIALGALAAIISALLLRSVQDKPRMPVFLSCVIGAVTVPILARLVYWYCSGEQFDGFFSAFSDYKSGGYSMIGAVCGLLLAGLAAHLLTRSSCPDQTPGELFDCLLPAGVIGTAIGRLAGYFDNADKGKAIVTKPAFQRMPFSMPVADSYTGEVSYRLAVFMFEAAAGVAIFALCMWVFSLTYQKKRPQYPVRASAIAALSFYMASQCVFDSMRYDALFLRSNGFVCLMQIFGAVTVVTCYVLALCFALKRGTISPAAAFILSFVSLALLAVAGISEYFVQRRGNLFLICYFFMFNSLIAVSAATLYLLRQRSKNSVIAWSE